MWHLNKQMKNNWKKLQKELTSAQQIDLMILQLDGTLVTAARSGVCRYGRLFCFAHVFHFFY